MLQTQNQLMKKLLFVFAVIGLLLPFAPQAKSQDVSVDFFYNNLNGGSWVEVGNYGYCWQPDVAVSDSSWRPYADGYWAYTEEGWTWTPWPRTFISTRSATFNSEVISSTPSTR